MKPSSIFVFDWKHKDSGWEVEYGVSPGVFVGGDTPALADMRFAAGCMVHLVVDDPARAVAWVERLLEDGAAHVIQSTDGEIHQWRT